MEAEFKKKVEEVIGHELYAWQERVLDMVVTGERRFIHSSRSSGRTQLKEDLAKLIEAGLIDGPK